MVVVSLEEYRSSEVIAALEMSLVLAKSGKLTGMTLVAEARGLQTPIVHICGTFRRDPLRAMGGLSAISHRLAMIDDC